MAQRSQVNSPSLLHRTTSQILVACTPGSLSNSVGHNQERGRNAGPRASNRRIHIFLRGLIHANTLPQRGGQPFTVAVSRHPSSSSTRATSTSPIRMAQCNAVLSYIVSALAQHRDRTTSACPSEAASIEAVKPSLLRSEYPPQRRTGIEPPRRIRF